MPNIATESAALRELLEKNVAWHWNHLQEESVQKLKQMASSTPILGYYDPSKPLCLSLCRCKFKGARCRSFARWEAPSLFIKNPQANPAAVGKNRKGNPCNCVWNAEMSSVHLWKNDRRRDRPQAIAIHLKQALAWSSTEAAEDDADIAAVRLKGEISTRIWTLCFLIH